MRNLLFWQRWPTPERRLFNIALLIFLLALIALGYYYVTTPAPVIGLQTIVESELLELPFETFRVGIFEMVVPANHYTITERFLGTPLEPNLLASNVWAICFAICITGLLAVATTASRYYFLAAMGVFILLVVSLKLETLLIFGRDDRTFSILVLLLYGFCGFYIFYFRPEMKFMLRFLCFLATTIVVAVLVIAFSQAQNPVLHLATYSFPASIIASVLFTVTVAHEIVAAFIFILTSKTRSGKTINHFLIITLIYLLNLVLAYMIRYHYVDWNVVTVNLYLLLAVSAVLGLWGLRQRHRQMEDIIDLEPHALTGYVFLGALALGALAWFMGTANDPAYDAVADVIIFSHLGYGCIFVLYVLSNFGGPLSQNMAVHKILYNPTSMPFFTFRLAGLIATMALVIYNTWQVPAHNAVAGYQNVVADMYLMEENTRVAAVFYNQGRTYGYANHHSNYALANLAGLKFDHEGEKGFYKAASYLRPTEASYLNWAQMFQSEDDRIGATHALQEGLTRFPRSAAISNTLGLIYAANGRPDSAALAFDDNNQSTTRSNMVALSARGQLPLSNDTSAMVNETPASLTNRLALASVSRRKSGIELRLPADSSITTAQATYMINYVAHHPGTVDTTTLSKIERLARVESNIGLQEPLLFACALSQYSSGAIQRAFKLMEEVAIISANKGKYNNILALWCLEQGEPIRAKEYADFAVSQGYTGAFYTSAVALTEQLTQSRQPTTFGEALHAWDSLAESNDSTVLNIGRRTVNILTANVSSAAALDEVSLLGMIRYRVPSSDTATSLRLIASLKDDNVRAEAMLGLSRSLLQQDNPKGALKILEQIRGEGLTDQNLRDRLRLHAGMVMGSLGDLDFLRNGEQLQPLSPSGNKEIYLTYVNALLAEDAKDTVRAAIAYEAIARSSWFFDEGLIAAAKFFQSHSTDILKSYKLLADAIQHHPSSIRLRKAYIREAKRVGFGDFVGDAMEALKTMIPESEYRRFAAEIAG